MKTARTVTLIPGDGVGPEIMDVVKNCVEATGAAIIWDVQNAGAICMEKEKTPLPARVLESVRKNRVAIKGPVTTPVGTGFRSVNVMLRKELDLYACVRPCKTYQGVRSLYSSIDLVVIRENTEDLYAGIEYAYKDAETKDFRKILAVRTKEAFSARTGFSIKPISWEASERIIRFAFCYAREHGRKMVTAVHKANIMKHTDGLFLEVFRQVAREYADIESQDRIVDNMAMQLVQKPQLYDVLVLPNLYGDIISDLCAGLVGGLGVAPGANIGEDMALFEPTHGSAPKYAGLNKVNPSAAILSAMLMLQYIGEREKASALERAVSRVIAEGKQVTYDMGGCAGTREMAMAVMDKLAEGI